MGSAAGFDGGAVNFKLVPVPRCALAWMRFQRSRPHRSGCQHFVGRRKCVLVLEKGRFNRRRRGRRTSSGHFDGQVIILDEPADMKPNTKVKIIAPIGAPSSDLTADFAIFSEPIFEKIWNNLDADYDAL